MGRPAQLIALALAWFCPADAKVSFNREIRPILSEQCFSCHGFDPKHRKADLRLDIREGALAVNDGVRAIIPGDPSKSELWKRLLSQDPEEVMPPPEAHKPKLSAKQLATLLHQMGLNHEKLSVRSQGLDVRLTGVNPAKILKPLLA
ncbi:MAG: hypothetical protein RL592_1127 [Verrucomicrobiota bacterium]|jgi:Planctomycete cytochrome C